MKIKLKKYLGFTLIELTLSVLIIGLIMPAMFSLYSFIIKSNKEIQARQNTIQQGYEFFERLNILMQDYTVDYEEYYNRKMVGCVGDTKRGYNFKWNVDENGYCTNFTAYGNENSGINGHPKYNDIYYCSSDHSHNNHAGLGRRTVSTVSCGKIEGKQSYGQYVALFTDVKGGEGIVIGSEDDVNLGDTLSNGMPINAINDEDHIQELYLISHDGKNRLYFRRKLVKPDDSTPEQDKKYTQYKIQMLRLRGFDAGRLHNFSKTKDGYGIINEGLYDGVIDTRACDTSMGFEPKNKSKANCENGGGEGNSVCGAYAEYYLPQDKDDCRIDLTYGSANVFAWNISIFPLGDSDLYRARHDRQINAFMKIMMINGVYFPAISSNITTNNSIKDFKVPLETTINMKDFYRGYSQ